MTQAAIGNWQLQISNNLSPEVYANLEEVLSVGEVGETNETLDVTNFDSTAGTKEFIGGLAEGDEVSIECNYIAGATKQTALRAYVAAKTNSTALLTYTGSSPNELYSFAFAPISWKLSPSTSEQNKINFTIKVSGGVTVA